ncbi:MAG: S-layer protein [Candidatus ainarchaeum sp.]|nr:S-layer protein [Candidatus ainarchaeum sp.]
MKGLNIKKVVALGIGAALIGSALAPVVSAANMAAGGLDNLERSNIISSTGMPVVDIVVGSNAAVSDVVWAGNIAAKVAQLATIPAGDAIAGGNAAVNVTVGGIVSMTGTGYTAEADLNMTSGVAELGPKTVNDVDVPYLVNQTGVTARWNGSNQTVSVREQITLTSADASMQNQTGSTRFAVGELVSSVARNAVTYEVVMNLDTSETILNMDSNSNYDVKIPFLGKVYVLNEINKTDNSLIMYSETIAQKLYPTETTTVPGAGNYAGKQLTVELETVWVNAAQATYNAVWVLKDGSTQINRREVQGSNYDLRDEFGSNVLGDSVYVTNVAQDVVASRYYASIRSGSERLELRDGKGFPYTGEPSVDDDAQWQVTLAGFGGKMTSIQLKNNWGFTSTSSESEVVKNVLTVGDEIALPNEYGVVRFVGFENKPMYDATIGNNKVSFRPLEGVSQVNAPMFIGAQLDVNRPRVVTISGQDYTLMLSDNNSAPQNFGRIYYAKGSFAGKTAAEVVSEWTASPSPIDVNRGDVSANLQFEVGARNAGTEIPLLYKLAVSENSDDRSFLLLAAQDFNLYNRGKANAALSFVGTLGLDSTEVAETYFLPNTSEVAQAIDGVTYDASKYYAAMFTYNDLDGLTAGADVNMFIRADATANVWDYDSIKDETAANKSNKTLDASYANWGTSAIRGGTDYLLSAFTADGSVITSDAGLFKISYPDERRQVQMYIGGSDLQESVVGGTSFTNLASGASETKGGVTVTIDSVSGVATGPVQGVVVKPVANNIVKTDASTNGKSIIVGGWMVNAAAVNLEVSGGQKLQDLITANGEYVAAVLTNGSIVVAGYTSADTGRAASDLINALEGLM